MVLLLHSLFFFSIEIVGIKSDVWKNISFNISSKYNKNITPAALRVRVALNRGGIRDKLGLILSKENKDDFSTGKC